MQLHIISNELNVFSDFLSYFIAAENKQYTVNTLYHLVSDLNDTVTSKKALINKITNDINNKI